MRVRGFLIPTLVLGSAVALAACGSSAKAPDPSAARVDAGLELSNCMRSHGVPNFPDPGQGGNISIGPSSGLNPQSPAFQSAQQACRRYFPNRGAPPTMSESERQAAYRFAKCMRRNGEPDFPDPTLTAPAGVTRVLVMRGMVFAIGTGIDPKTAAFREAAARCGVTPPGGAPQ
jgi:hypothetical protein